MSVTMTMVLVTGTTPLKKSQLLPQTERWQSYRFCKEWTQAMCLASLKDKQVLLNRPTRKSFTGERK